MAISPISPRMRRMQWIAIGLATAAIALNYVDRSTLAIGNIKIRAGIRHQRHRDRCAAIRMVDHLCAVPGADRLFPRSARATMAGRRGTGAVVGGAGGGRIRGLVRAIAVGARGAGRGRVPGLSRRGAGDQRLVPREGSRRARPAYTIRRQHRSVHRPAFVDRPDAGVRLADDVHHHGRRRCAGRAGVVQAVPRPGEDRTRAAGPGVSRRRTARPRARWRHATGAGCSGSSRCGD